MVCYADVYLHKISDMMESMNVCLSTLRSVLLRMRGSDDASLRNREFDTLADLTAI
jgi:hypothetical protein